MLALFESLGGWELALVGVAALLLFGKDLPRVAAEAGSQIAKLRRGLDSAWRETGLEKEVRQIRDALPRDLSLGDVARTAREKLAVRLEDDETAKPAEGPDDAARAIPPPSSPETVARATSRPFGAPAPAEAPPPDDGARAAPPPEFAPQVAPEAPRRPTANAGVEPAPRRQPPGPAAFGAGIDLEAEDAAAPRRSPRS